jgi:hypothetical protein
MMDGEHHRLRRRRRRSQRRSCAKETHGRWEDKRQSRVYQKKRSFESRRRGATEAEEDEDRRVWRLFIVRVAIKDQQDGGVGGQKIINDNKKRSGLIYPFLGRQ